MFDSVEEEEYEETINKLMGNVRAVEAAEGQCLHLACILLAVTDSDNDADYHYAIQQAKPIRKEF